MLKLLNLKNKNSLKVLKVFLEKRKTIQKQHTITVNKIIQNVKKNGDKAVLNYEKKFSKVNTKSNKIIFSSKEINKISKKTDLKIRRAIDGIFPPRIY